MDSVLNEDLTTLSNISPFLKQCVGKGKEIPPGSILQVQQITNVSFPTYDKPHYDPDRHTLKITVTDGQSQGYALVPDSCPGISLNTPPGTKIKTTHSIPVHGSLFIITRNNCEVLGGRVAKLFEKWEFQKKVAFKHEWGYTGSSVEGEGPPPWKPFGYKPSIDVAALRKMKTIDVVSEKKDCQTGAAKTQFDMQRDEAISELQATANKQKFQKPNKHLLDKEITDIMDEGFPQADAEYAMNRFKNTQKALKFLKESKQRYNGLPKEPKPIIERKDRRRKGKGLDDDEEQEVPAEYQRPTKNISLFGFIEGRIKTDEKPVQANNGPTSQNYGRSRDLEESMGRMNLSYSRGDSYGHSRGDRGRGRGYRGGGGRGGSSDGGSGRGGSNRDSFHSQSQRYDNMSAKQDPVNEKPPRFQNRGGDSRSDYHGPSHHRSQHSEGGAYDNYRGSGSHHGRDSYDSRTYPDPQMNRQEYSSNYQQRPTTGKDRSLYGSGSTDYQQQQHYSSGDYPNVPSQKYQQPYQQQHQSNSRQYMNNSQNHDSSHHRGSSGQQRPSSHFSTHSTQNHPSQPPPHSEFTQYQYGYEGWNPAQSLVFTRSKPGETRGRGGGAGTGSGGGYSGNGRGNSVAQNNSYGRSNQNYSRY